MLVANKMLCVILIAGLTIGCYQPASNISLNNQNPSANSIPVKLVNSFSLRVNQVGLIESENLELRLLEVRNDSRCPSGIECIWPGMVEVVINVAKDDHDAELILIDKEGEDDLASKTFDNYLIKLIEVTPYPQKNQKIEIEDYSATLKVVRE